MKPYRSIRWILIMWNMLLLAVVLITLLSLHYHLQRKSEMAQLDSAMHDTLMKILPLVASPDGSPPGGRRPEGEPPFNRPPPGAPPPDGFNTTEAISEVMSELETEHVYITVWTHGTRMVSYGDAPAFNLDNYAGNPAEENWTIMRDDYRELVTRHPGGMLVVIGQPMAEVNKQLKHLRGYLTLIGCAIFLLGYGGGRYIISRALLPIREISNAAEEISAGAHSRRIELAAAPEELESLATTLNNSFNHLDHALENQKRFSADASHELRTPIAVVMAQTQAALKRDRSTEEYKKILQACQRAADRMKTMADSLLDLTRIDGNQAALSIQAQPLNRIVSLAVSDAAQLSNLHSVKFVETSEELSAKIDQERIHQILMNLMRNSIQHNPDGCSISVTTTQEGNSAVIVVSDDGIGIPSASLPHVFERFYRADKSRSQAQGGAGLGLSIVRSIVEAHGGRIEVSSTEEEGATFSISLPLA